MEPAGSSPFEMPMEVEVSNRAKGIGALARFCTVAGSRASLWEAVGLLAGSSPTEC